jgi:hypothetical protein
VAPPSAGGIKLPYVFPFEHPKFIEGCAAMRGQAPEHLVDLLGKLSFGRSSKGAGPKLAYEQIRYALCAISILLNERGWPAPRFRPIRKPSKGTALPADEKILSNDRQVIDLHWLRCNEKISPKPAHRALFEGESFDFARASRFVEKVGTPRVKTEDLILTERQQLLLGVLQTDPTRDRWRTIEAALQRAEAALRDYAERGPARLTDHQIPAWLNAFKALAAARGDIASAMKVYKAITGQSISRTLMERRLRDLEKRGAKLP